MQKEPGLLFLGRVRCKIIVEVNLRKEGCHGKCRGMAAFVAVFYLLILGMGHGSFFEISAVSSLH